MYMVEYVLYPVITFMTTYMGVSMIYYILDIHVVNNNRLIERYKRQNTQVLVSDYKKVFWPVMINMIIMSVCNGMILTIIYHDNNITNEISKSVIIMEFMKLFINKYIYEIFFTIGHYMMHKNKYLFVKIHKKHHENNKPFGMSGLYMTKSELIYVGIICFQIGIYITNMHYITLCIYTFMATLIFISSHSGYCDKILITNKRHDKHHEYYNCNYSNERIIDIMMGTNMD